MLQQVKKGCFKMSNLPPEDTKRWVIRKKYQIVEALKNRVITFNQALERYSLSRDELESWIVLAEEHGILGLRATRAQDYRNGVFFT